MADGTDIATPRQLSISDSAVRRIAELGRQAEFRGLALRVTVSGGGCSGFQYGFTFDDTKREDDHEFTRQGVRVLVDDSSLDLVAGSEIDYIEDLIGASFAVRNPNAKSTCGCGNSFAVG